MLNTEYTFQFSLGSLAAEDLIVKADNACRCLAKSLEDLGKKIDVNMSKIRGGEWCFVCLLANKLDKQNTLPQNITSNTLSINSLAAKRIRDMMSVCLLSLIESTRPLLDSIASGKELGNQYDEGLITGEEYLNKLIDEISHL